MEFAHGTGFDSEETDGEIEGCWESLGVEDFYTAAGDFVGCLFGEMVRVAFGVGNVACGTGDVVRWVRNICWESRAVENIQLVLGDVVEGREIDAKVLGQDGLGVSGKEFGDEEGIVFTERAFVEDEKEFDAGRAGLDAVRDSGWEEPDVALREIVGEGFAGFVDGIDADGAV